MLGLAIVSTLAAAAVSPLVAAVSSQSYAWKNVKIGGGGGFVPGFVFSTKEKGVAYARTDIGGLYRLNADDSWTPLLDFADDARWNYWGVDTFALDPTDASRVYAATGMYTNSWDPNNGQILISKDQGASWTASKLPFKVGGNMPGRGAGERLAVDPNSPNILFFGARSGNGLWKSIDYGVTWTKVSSLPNTGTYKPDPTDTTGLNSDAVGVSFVTFDSTSGSSGKASPRIFVGVATVGSSNLFVSNDGGSTFSALSGTNSSWIPHKGVLSPSDKALYISTSDGAGPYDGTAGGVYRYDIAAGKMSDITPVSGSDLTYGFGGVAVDLQKPGTIMVAALNEWWPDGQIFRSTDSGKTWSRLWEWGNYPTQIRHYTYDDSLAPWLGPNYTIDDVNIKQIGWMMESLVIDPFDSNHWLYGTGATVYGGHDLLKWDSGASRNITLKSLADGIEETSVQALISPPSGPTLVSAVGDLEGFVHNDLDKAPQNDFVGTTWTTTIDIDYAGNKPTNYVRIGNAASGKQIALSTDSGATWSLDANAGDGVQGGKVALSADGDTILWRTSSSVLVSQNSATYAAVSGLPADAQIASDKRSNKIFYGASGGKFYISRDSGKTFTSPSALDAITSPAKVVVNPSVSGDVWVSGNTGLLHSTDFGATFTTISAVSQAWQISLGAPKTAGGYPALYANAKVGGTYGLFRSDDAGVNWVQINDAGHGFGAAGYVVTADQRTYGRVFIGTNGRGIFYGTVSGVAPSPTATGPSTTAQPSSTSATVPSSSSMSTTTSKPVSSSSTTTSKPVSSSSTTTSKPISSSSSTTVSTTSKPTTSVPVSTTKASSAPSSTATGVVQWYQCGGIGYSGPSICAKPYVCTKQNDYYWQCI